MDSSKLEELNKCPFGRQLHLLAHRLPRTCKLGADWELERGFHLQVVDEDIFELTLASRSPASLCLPIWDQRDGQGQDTFLVYHLPGAYRADSLRSFAEALRQRPHIQVGLILSHTTERGKATLDFPRFRGLWKTVPQPVVQIFQDFPPKSYFTVEKSLFDLGRVGRRLLRLGKIRRLMPW